MLTTYRLICKTLHIFHRKTFEFYLIASQVGLDVLVFLLKGMCTELARVALYFCHCSPAVELFNGNKVYLVLAFAVPPM